MIGGGFWYYSENSQASLKDKNQVNLQSQLLKKVQDSKVQGSKVQDSKAQDSKAQDSKNNGMISFLTKIISYEELIQKFSNQSQDLTKERDVLFSDSSKKWLNSKKNIELSKHAKQLKKKSINLQKKLQKVKRKGRHTSPKITPEVQPKKDTSPDQSALITQKTLITQKIQVRSRYKGASVFINGKKAGQIYEIERNEGISLPMGRKHRVEIRSSFCEDYLQEVTLTPKMKRPPRVVFDCQFKPATLKVISSKDAEIYVDGRSTLRLGLTNQEIKYKMNQANLKLSLLVVSPNAPDSPLTVQLIAGQRIEVKL